MPPESKKIDSNKLATFCHLVGLNTLYSCQKVKHLHIDVFIPRSWLIQQYIQRWMHCFSLRFNVLTEIISKALANSNLPIWRKHEEILISVTFAMVSCRWKEGSITSVFIVCTGKRASERKLESYKKEKKKVFRIPHWFPPSHPYCTLFRDWKPLQTLLKFWQLLNLFHWYN